MTDYEKLAQEAKVISTFVKPAPAACIVRLADAVLVLSMALKLAACAGVTLGGPFSGDPEFWINAAKKELEEEK